MASRKRFLESFDDVSSINKASESAKVSAIVSNLSPMKRNKSNKNYFDGSLTDGKSEIRMIGFDQKLQQQLASYRESKEMVIISNYCKLNLEGEKAN